MSMNQFILDGNLTRAPETRYTASGMPVCTFTVASNTVHLFGDERVEEVAFIPVTAIGKLADTSGRNLRKGAGVTVIGRLGSWKGGFTFKAERVIFRSPRARSNSNEAADAPAKSDAGHAEVAAPDQRWIDAFETASQSLAQAH